MLKKAIIITLIIVAIVVAVFLLKGTKSEEEYNNFKVQDFDYEVKNVNIPITGNYITSDVNLDEVKNKIKNTDIFQKIPEDSIISMQFFDGNGNMIDKGLTIYGDGNIKDSIDSNNDFKVITGNYYIDTINTNDVCKLFNDIKNSNDYRFESTKSKMELMWKYRGLIKECML